MKWKKVFHDIDKTLTCGVTVFFIFVVSFMYWKHNPTDAIPFYYLAITISLCFLLCLVFYAVLSYKKEEIIYRLPKIINFFIDTDLLIVEDNELLTQDLLTSIYYYDERRTAQTFIGIGFVEVKNSNGYFQVKLIPTSYNETQKEKLIEITNQKKFDLLIIRPGIRQQDNIIYRW